MSWHCLIAKKTVAKGENADYQQHFCSFPEMFAKAGFLYQTTPRSRISPNKTLENDCEKRALYQCPAIFPFPRLFSILSETNCIV